MDEYKTLIDNYGNTSKELFIESPIENDPDETLSDRILHFIDCCSRKNFNDIESLNSSLFYLSDNISHLSTYHISDQITSRFVAILFELSDDFFKTDDPKTSIFEKIPPNFVEHCVMIISNLMKFLPFDYFTSGELIDVSISCFNLYSVNEDQAIAPLLSEWMNLFLPLLVNLSSTNEEIWQMITFGCIDSFYKNPLINSKQKEELLKILLNMLHFSDVNDESFQIEDWHFLINEILSMFDSKHTFVFIQIIYLLAENPVIAGRLMGEIPFVNCINNCLNSSFLKMIYKNDETIHEIHIYALKILSLILNLEDYSIDIDLNNVIELSQNMDNPDVVFAAMTTLQNFIDCEAHVQLMLQSEIFSFLSESIENGTSSMKVYAYKILTNLIFYASGYDVDFLLSVNALSILAEYLISYDDIETAVVGLLNFLKKAKNRGHDIETIFCETNLDSCLDNLKDTIDDDDALQAINELIVMVAKT